MHKTGADFTCTWRALSKVEMVVLEGQQEQDQAVDEGKCLDLRELRDAFAGHLFPLMGQSSPLQTGPSGGSRTQPSRPRSSRSSATAPVRPARHVPALLCSARQMAKRCPLPFSIRNGTQTWEP